MAEYSMPTLQVTGRVDYTGEDGDRDFGGFSVTNHLGRLSVVLQGARFLNLHFRTMCGTWFTRAYMILRPRQDRPDCLEGVVEPEDAVQPGDPFIQPFSAGQCILLLKM